VSLAKDGFDHLFSEAVRFRAVMARQEIQAGCSALSRGTGGLKPRTGRQISAFAAYGMCQVSLSASVRGKNLGDPPRGAA
jgi:hypothetical protein